MTISLQSPEGPHVPKCLLTYVTNLKKVKLQYACFKKNRIGENAAISVIRSLQLLGHLIYTHAYFTSKFFTLMIDVFGVCHIFIYFSGIIS